MKRLFCISFLVLSQALAFGQWTQTSGPSGGGVSDFAFVGGTILAATFDLGNGVYASSDGGSSWHESGLQGRMLSCMTAFGNTVLAATTQNSYNETDTIFRSSDGGQTWHLPKFVIDNKDTTNGAIADINGVRCIRYHNHQWYLTTSGQKGSMYVSDDDGMTWNYFHPAFTFSHPVILLSADASLIVGTSSEGHIEIYRSTDGTTWLQATLGLDTTINSQIYCGTVTGSTIMFGAVGGVIYSRDGGVSWTQPKMDSLKDKQEYISHLAGSGNNIIAISSLNHIFSSHDGGQTWTILTGNGLPANASYFFSAGFDSARGVAYIGSSTGILSESVLSNTWKYSTDGLRAAAVTDVVASAGKIFVITERGVSFSSDIGQSWHDPKDLTDLGDVPIGGFLKGSSNFYAFGKGLYSWNGSNWNTVDTGKFVALAEGSAGRLFASRPASDPISGFTGIDISDNGGAAWGTALSFANSFDTEMYFLPRCLSSNGSGTVVAAQRAILFQTFTSKYFIYRSDDNGFSWGQPNPVSSPAFITYTDNTFYMGTYGNGLFVSNDNGQTWSGFSSMPSGIDVSSLLKLGSTTLLISVTGNGHAADGLYFSTNNGSSWKYANGGTANIAGPLTTDGTYLYSSGPSVWRRPLQGLGVHDSKQEAGIPLELYPNPAGDIIHVHIGSAEPMRGSLIIYDEKGMAVSKHDAYAESNSEDITVSTSGLSEGTYYAMLTGSDGATIGATKFVVQRK